MAEAANANSTTHLMTLVDWLDDLTVRFLLNLPPSELSSVPRICFQIEEAQWFYEDFIRPANPNLPSLNLRSFLLALFQHCPLLQGFDAAQHVAAYDEFMTYKTRVPVRGAILLDDDMEKVLLVKGWKKSASWSFPRGKINKDEPDLACAIREVYEETGFDMDAAGLVTANLQKNGKVKAIDVEMKEQHMQLFVFRGVALDTHFEPKTRKEISKIQWYNIKDLPGFKRQKGVVGHGQGEAQSSKFYMVAPFIGPLKKWISQQKKNDAMSMQAESARSLSAAHEGHIAGTEDEGETEQEGFVSDAGLGTGDRSASEIKRMLSVTGPADETPDPSKNLLAMLRGGPIGAPTNALPHTPYEQIDPIFPATQPQAPQPQHPRQNAADQPTTYAYPYAPQRPQQHYAQHGQNHRSPDPAAEHGRNPAHFGHPSQTYIPGFGSHMQQQDTPRYGQQSASGQGSGPQLGPHANAAASSLNLFQQTQTSTGGYFGGTPIPQRSHTGINPAGPGAQLASSMQFATGSNKPPAALAQMLQETQKPIGSEMPEASRLPTLNSQSKKLLEVFKTSTASKPIVTAPGMAPSVGQRAGSVQQAALLDLFKKSEAASTLPEPVNSTSAPTADSSADSIARPSSVKKADRKPTLNEITRTLPAKRTPAPNAHVTVGVLSPRAQQSATPKQALSPRPDADQALSAERPTARGQLFDPANPKKFVRAASKTLNEGPDVSVPHVAILHRPSSRQGASPSKGSSPSAGRRSNPNENGQPATTFSILQRPGSAAGKTQLPRPPSSPLRNEAQNTEHSLQMLAKPSKSDNAGAVEIATGSPAPDKKDHLLSLFAKAPVVNAGTPTKKGPSLQVPEAARATSQPNNLLNLLNGSRAPPSPLAKSPDPPPTPQLAPERKPSRQEQRSNGGHTPSSQQLLLNLFNKAPTSTVSSPSTPMSPFTLDTPISREPPHRKQPLPLSVQSMADSRSRLDPVASAATPTASGQGTPTMATPTNETKGFLLGYLNDVVQKEGYKSAKRG